MKPAPFDYHAPASLTDALSLLDTCAGQGGRVLAGGQSLVPMMALRLAEPPQLVDIGRIDGLDALTVEDDLLTIGALVRHARFHSPGVGGSLGRLLRDVSSHIAHLPIRLRGTFCGSLANADPASEWCLLAAVLGARMTACRATGSRTIAADAFFDGVMETALAPEEILTAVQIPVPPPGTCMGFQEFSRRRGDFALAMALVSYRIEDELVAEPRVGLGGVEEKPRRIAAAEAALVGRRLGPGVVEASARAAAAAIEPLVDHQTTEAYRRSLAATMVVRAFARAQASSEHDG